MMKSERRNEVKDQDVFLEGVETEFNLATPRSESGGRAGDYRPSSNVYPNALMSGAQCSATNAASSSE